MSIYADLPIVAWLQVASVSAGPKETSNENERSNEARFVLTSFERNNIIFGIEVNGAGSQVSVGVYFQFLVTSDFLWVGWSERKSVSTFF